MHTPFFPGFRARFAPCRQHLEKLRQHSLCQLELLLSPFLPPGLLAQEDEGDNSRDRIYNKRRTFFGFLYQALNPKCPCREIVRQIQALLSLRERDPADEGNSAYCQARQRLALDTLQAVRRGVGAAAEKSADRWHGMRPKVVDGTALSLPDTPENQHDYPQSRSQKAGCGFPLLHLVGVFSLATGVLLDYAAGNKHQQELSLLWRMFDQFRRGDLVLGDRGFGSYAIFALLWLREVPALFRLHQKRSPDLRRGKRLGKNDRLITWRKPREKPPWLPRCWWNKLPDQLTVRVLRYSLYRPGFRSRSMTLVTTLLDPEVYTARELAELYLRRWQVELRFRDIKTSMGMEVLRCKSPKMVQKELEMFLIAYNLIRCLMVQAASLHSTDVARMSFKGTVDSVRQFSIAIAQARSQRKQKQLMNQLLEIIARDKLPDRPGRREPRALKRRPKPYQLLNRPRHLMKDIPHKDKYRKNFQSASL
jgi:hypothetical protein